MSCAMLALSTLPVAIVGWRTVFGVNLTASRREASGMAIISEPDVHHNIRKPLRREASSVHHSVPATAPTVHPPRASSSTSLSHTTASPRGNATSTAEAERSNRQSRGTVIARAVPTEVSGAVAAAVVAVSLALLVKQGGGDQVEDTSKPPKPQCEACSGSGVCGRCRGEGFVAKDLSPEDQARAKARSQTAATRNTAALARKWNYCPECGGGRACRPCDGRGFLESA